MKIINLNVHGDERGSLIAVEEYSTEFPYPIKRIYYLYETKYEVTRGTHAHRELKQLLICLHGKCNVILDNSHERVDVLLDSPDKAILLEEPIWRDIYHMSSDCVLMVLASDIYKPEDYIHDYDGYVSWKNEMDKAN
jgi:dTDP-4-dehydrorhamnose 3,5-epimerase-like enzyme